MTAKILVAEDQSDLREMIAATLSLSGYEVVAATDGAQAYERAQADGPDLIILDLDLPHLRGNQVCERLKSMERFNGTPIVIISAHNGAAEIEDSLRAGAQEHICKPFELDHLTRRVAALLMGT